MHSLNIRRTRCIKHGVKHKVHQVQRKQIDSHKVCAKCPPLARIQALPLVNCVINQRLKPCATHAVAADAVVVVVVAVVYLHEITTYINIREISQMNHANKDLKEVKNL